MNQQHPFPYGPAEADEDGMIPLDVGFDLDPESDRANGGVSMRSYFMPTRECQKFQFIIGCSLEKIVDKPTEKVDQCSDSG